MVPQLLIHKLILTPTNKSYSDIHYRGYNMTALTSAQLTSAVNTIIGSMDPNGGQLSNIDVANKLSGLISLSSGLGPIVKIPNGWSCIRYRFILLVEMKINNSYSTMYTIQGFTDFADSTRDLRFLDPHMVLYFNSVNENTITRTRDPFTGNIVHSYSNTNSYNILQNIDVNNRYTNNNLVLTRPKDVHTDIYHKCLQNNEYVLSPINVGVYNTHELESSKRTNNDSTLFLTSILNAYDTAKKTDSVASYNLPSEAYQYNEASKVSMEPELQRNKFFFNLEQQLATNNMSKSYYTWGELLKVFPELDSIKTIIPSSHSVVTQIEGDIVSLNTPNPITSQMTQLSNSLTSMLVNSLLSEANIAVKINPYTRTYDVIILSGNSLLSQDMVIQSCEKFKQLLINITLPYLFNNAHEIIEMRISIDLFNDTIINYIVEGENNVRTFCFPTFADSLYNNVITTKNGKETLTNCVSELIQSVDDAQLQMNSNVKMFTV